MKHYDELDNCLDVFCSAALKVGDMLLEKRTHFIQNVEKKLDGSIVCKGDLESSLFLNDLFQKKFPCYGLLDEESIEEDNRSNNEYCIFIDPLESTIDYVKGGDNFGIMLGLTKNFSPVIGVVYRPFKGELIYAIKGNGAFCEDAAGKRRICVSDSCKKSVLVSKFRTNEQLALIIKAINPTTITKMTSAFKIIEVAKGNYTLFISPPATTLNLWDLCAPSVILREAGGKISDCYGCEINYGGDVTNRDGIIASNSILYDYVQQELSAVFVGLDEKRKTI